MPPNTSYWEISADLLGKPGKRRKEKRENGEEKKENRKSKGGNLKWKEEEQLQNEEGIFFFHFLKPLKLFWVYHTGDFLPRKKHITPGKYSGKMTLPPLKKFPLTP